MRYVQFAQPFAQEFGKVVVVVDVWQELTVGGAHGIPVYAVHIGVVETFLLLFVHMPEHIFAFCRQIHFNLRLISDGFQRIGRHIHFLHGFATQQEEVLAVFVHFHGSPAGIHFVKEPGIFLAEIHFPKVVTVFKGCEVIKAFTVFGDDDAAHIRRIRGETYNAVFNVFQFNDNVFHLRLVIAGLFLFCFFLAALFIFGGILVLRFLLFGFQFFAQLVIFFAQAVFVVSVLIEENKHGVVLRTP
ncbi:membrane protein [Bacteroides clarus CAG:160]|nr:membrane protein [Bacteroides clarus CAG:160]